MNFLLALGFIRKWGGQGPPTRKEAKEKFELRDKITINVLTVTEKITFQSKHLCC